jgi:hypothetical protein
MSVETFTDSEEAVVVHRPIAFPMGLADSIGWVVEVDGKTGVVIDTENYSTGSMKVQFDGECPRPCCLTKVKINDATFVGPVACDCGSGHAAVLCLCEEPDLNEDQVSA